MTWVIGGEMATGEMPEPFASEDHSMSIKLLTTAQVAEILLVKPGTLRLWRMQEKGPDFRKIGHYVRYAEKDVLSYLDSTTRSHTHQTACAKS